MTKVLRTLMGSGLALVVAALILGGTGLFQASDADAQAPPGRPSRFAGSVLVDGAAPAAGTVITAWVGNSACGVTTTFNVGAESRYVVDVQALEPGAELKCGTVGAKVSFTIGDKLAKETGTWDDGELGIVNLTYTTPSTATPTATTTPTGTATGTPKPPATGSGTATSGDQTTLWALGLLGAGLVVLSAGGFAAVRRGK
jgi:hypothetical protein